jgi:hypothetical protein
MVAIDAVEGLIQRNQDAKTKRRAVVSLRPALVLRRSLSLYKS